MHPVSWGSISVGFSVYGISWSVFLLVCCGVLWNSHSLLGSRNFFACFYLGWGDISHSSATISLLVLLTEMSSMAGPAGSAGSARKPSISFMVPMYGIIEYEANWAVKRWHTLDIRWPPSKEEEDVTRFQSKTPSSGQIAPKENKKHIRRCTAVRQLPYF